jgi:hypothetical protein
MSEVRRVGANSFAARPLTLKFILRIFHQELKLPRTQVEMYRRGCLHLAQEHNPQITESMLRPKVTAERRLQIARRIAAMCVFCGKAWIERIAPANSMADGAGSPEVGYFAILAA